MPALSKKQQRLFGMVHALQTGKLSKRKVSGQIRAMAKKIDPESVEHFAKTKHNGLPEKKDDGSEKKAAMGLYVKLGVYRELLRRKIFGE